MIELAILYRAINLFSHHAHNLTKGITFFEDHAFLGDLYPLMDDFYDSVIERYIGTKSDSLNLHEIVSKANDMLSKSNDKYFETIQSALEHALSMIKTISPKESLGTQNLLADQADKIEVLLYKIKRKLK
jgi:DNA-binding ferritin-like protein